MAEPVDFNQEKIKRLEAQLADLRAPLRGGGGGGTFDGMDTRVAVLEAHMEHVREDLTQLKGVVGQIKTDVTTLKGTVSTLPSKGFVVTAVLTALGVLTALLTLQTVVTHFWRP